jgi:phage shock protein PspC (stress-responsive transcriptional regulator)
MNKVIIINLNGNAYQLEEDAYDALRAYLDTARARLEGNPDRDEIIADIEQAIADKFRGLLGANKSVVLLNEVKGVIAEMGPVEDAGGAGSAQGASAQGAADAPKAAPADAQGAPRRLYRIQDGAMLAGVCNGLSAYLGIDVSFIRIMFLVLSIVWGFGAVIYVIMAFTIPSATTSAEKAAAFGTPSTSQDFIKRAREGYYAGMKTFRDRHEYREWKRKFKAEMRGWRQDMKREVQRNAHQWADNWHRHWAQHGPPFFGAWFLAPVFGLLSAALVLVMVFGIISILLHGAFLGFGVPAGMPHWVAIIIFIFVLQFVFWPLKAMRHALYYGYGPPYYHPFVHFWNAVFGIAMIVFVVWLFSHHPAQVHEAIHNLGHELRAAFESFRDWLNTL